MLPLSTTTPEQAGMVISLPPISTSLLDFTRPPYETPDDFSGCPAAEQESDLARAVGHEATIRASLRFAAR